MPPKKDRADINQLIWNRIMHIFTDKPQNRAGCDLHQQSLIDLHLFIDTSEAKRKHILH
jgi:hypothetical protein